METKVGFFEEAPGVKSSTRLNSFLMLIFFCVFSFYYAISKECDLNADFIAYSVILLIAVFAPKYFQKVAEMRLGTTSTTVTNTEVTISETEKKK